MFSIPIIYTAVKAMPRPRTIHDLTGSLASSSPAVGDAQPAPVLPKVPADETNV